MREEIFFPFFCGSKNTKKWCKKKPLGIFCRSSHVPAAVHMFLHRLSETLAASFLFHLPSTGHAGGDTSGASKILVSAGTEESRVVSRGGSAPVSTTSPCVFCLSGPPQAELYPSRVPILCTGHDHVFGSNRICTDGRGSLSRVRRGLLLRCLLQWRSRRG